MKPIFLLVVSVALTTAGCTRATPTGAPTTIKATPSQPTASPMGDKWPFADAENTAAFTLNQIADGEKPILYVVHDEDGDWQFLDGGAASEEDAAVVSLKNIAELDPSIKQLADLPVGWKAERTSVDQPWQRSER